MGGEECNRDDYHKALKTIITSFQMLQSQQKERIEENGLY